MAAFLTAVILWRSLVKTALRWFIPFLFLIVVAEFTGRYLVKELHQQNAWLYSFEIPIEYLFFAMLFLLHYKRKVNRNIAIIFLSGFSIYALVVFIMDGITIFNTNFLLIGSFFMIVLSLLYLFELYLDPPQTMLLLTPMFWVTTGLLLFNAGEFSYNLLSEFFIYDRVDPSLRFFRSINNRLILILYSCFIIAFICQSITYRYRKE